MEQWRLVLIGTTLVLVFCSLVFVAWPGSSSVSIFLSEIEMDAGFLNESSEEAPTNVPFDLGAQNSEQLNSTAPTLEVEKPDLSNDKLIRGIYNDPEDEYFDTSCKRQNKTVKVYHDWKGWSWVQTKNDGCEDWCYLVTDQNTADLVVFHAPTTPPSQRRFPEQKIATWSGEPKGVYDIPWQPNLDADISVTYNMDSNMPIFYLERDFWDQAMSVPIPTREEYAALKDIIWVSSNCVPDRTAMMQSLMNLVHIEARGSCLNNAKKVEGIHRDLPSVYREYKVVITFEKFWDPDYISEKFYYLFTSGRVGVYFGLDAAHFYAPGVNSFVFARDFDIPSLAEELKALVTDYDKWVKYLEWKRNPQRPRGYRRIEKRSVWTNNIMCRLCNCACNSTCSDAHRGGNGISSITTQWRNLE